MTILVSELSEISRLTASLKRSVSHPRVFCSWGASAQDYLKNLYSSLSLAAGRPTKIVDILLENQGAAPLQTAERRRIGDRNIGESSRPEDPLHNT